MKRRSGPPVRVEAGWDRRAPMAAPLNCISRARDLDLDATVAQVAEASPKPVAILTSDVSDMAALVAIVEGEIRVVHL